MAKLAEKIVDNFYAVYLNDGDFLKIEIKEGKIVKESENTIHIFCVAETGISPDEQPLKITVHKGKYRGYNMKERKYTDGIQAYPVEEFIFQQLEADDFPKDGFSGVLVHHKDLKDYKGKQPISNVEENSCENLPALPSGNGNSQRKGYSPVEQQTGLLEARSAFMIAQFNEFLKSQKIELQCETISDVFMLIAKTSNENPDSGEKMLQFSRFIASMWKS